MIAQLLSLFESNSFYFHFICLFVCLLIACIVFLFFSVLLSSSVWFSTFFAVISSFVVVCFVFLLVSDEPHSCSYPPSFSSRCDDERIKNKSQSTILGRFLRIYTRRPSPRSPRWTGTTGAAGPRPRNWPATSLPSPLAEQRGARGRRRCRPRADCRRRRHCPCPGAL